MRAFVAIDLDEPFEDDLLDLQARLNVGRMVPTDNLHLTLAFFGEQPSAAVEALHEELDLMALPAFGLRLRGLDLIGGARSRALALLADASDELSGLHDAIVRAARRAGITLERRRFRPHVTLARLKDGGQSQARLQRALSLGAEAEIGPVPVQRFALYQSFLSPSGAHHEILADYSLIGLVDGAS